MLAHARIRERDGIQIGDARNMAARPITPWSPKVSVRTLASSISTARKAPKRRAVNIAAVPRKTKPYTGGWLEDPGEQAAGTPQETDSGQRCARRRPVDCPLGASHASRAPIRTADRCPARETSRLWSVGRYMPRLCNSRARRRAADPPGRCPRQVHIHRRVVDIHRLGLVVAPLKEVIWRAVGTGSRSAAHMPGGYYRLARSNLWHRVCRRY